MEYDQIGKITKFDVGDSIVLDGVDYVVDASAANNLNEILELVNTGFATNDLLSIRGAISLVRKDYRGFSVGLSHLKIFQNLPVDLSRVSQ